MAGALDVRFIIFNQKKIMSSEEITAPQETENAKIIQSAGFQYFLNCHRERNRRPVRRVFGVSRESVAI
jgi:hypothetical protein